MPRDGPLKMLLWPAAFLRIHWQSWQENNYNDGCPDIKPSKVSKVLNRESQLSGNIK